MKGPRGPLFLRGLAQAVSCPKLDQAKALAHQHHIFAESPEPAEIGPVGVAPIGEASIALTLIVGKGGVDVMEAPIGDLGAFDDTAWFSPSVEHEPALAGRGRVRFVFRAACRGLDTLDDEVEQFIGERRTVAEGEGPQVSIVFGDRPAHERPAPPASTACGPYSAPSTAFVISAVPLLPPNSIGLMPLA